MAPGVHAPQCYHDTVLETSSMSRPPQVFRNTALRCRLCDGVWQELRRVHTNCDGRGAGLSDGLELRPGVYRVTFDTQAYYKACGLQYCFYPQPEVDFTVTVETQSQHFHIPLLLSPFSYTTYRGS